ncbi:MAG: nucleotidyltransferase family protein [Acidobacteria bacterium]|nr:nucleotidyltransferase family protein [Acidobacteriota bacterium]
MTARCGLVLLTGGRGERLGGPKHDRAHPLGGSWGGHLVRVFRAVVPDGPVCVLGAALPEHPELPRLDDPREGPAVALRTWAASAPPPARRWWILACDQIAWTERAFSGWISEAESADPEGEAWAFVVRDGHRQPLGGFLGGALVAPLALGHSTHLQAVLDQLPSSPLSGATWKGGDIDTPDDLAAFGLSASSPSVHPARP